MKWHRRGQIFDFDTSAFSAEYVGFAQSPQVLDCGDFVRIYFSTRQRSSEGKFVSLIQYVEMDRGFRNVLRTSSHTVVPLGGLGTFDEHGIFPFSVFRHGDGVWGYSNGWSRRKSVSVETSISEIRQRPGADRITAGTLPGVRPVRAGLQGCISHVVHLRHRLARASGWS